VSLAAARHHSSGASAFQRGQAGAPPASAAVSTSNTWPCASCALQAESTVRGLERHLQLQEAARRRAEEQRSREARIFIEKPSTPSTLFTVPQPFHLTYDSHPRRQRTRQARAQSAAAHMVEECTFQPATRARTQKMLIKKILSEEDGGDVADMFADKDQSDGACDC
jgi:hypothetical protein